MIERPDRAKELNAARVVHIGPHELIQGDCLEVIPALGEVDAVVTDPPYGMAFHSNYRKQKHKKILGDGDVNLLTWACGLPVSHSAYIWCRWDNLRDIPAPKSVITWVKNNWSMGDLEHEHARQTEVCVFYKGADHYFPKSRPQDVVMANRSGNEYHPTQKPVALMRQVLEWTDGSVCDPFMGSGTTGVACQQLGRIFIGIEKDPDYFEIACKRVAEAHSQPSLFEEPVPKKIQNGNLFDGDAA